MPYLFNCTFEVVLVLERQFFLLSIFSTYYSDCEPCSMLLMGKGHATELYKIPLKEGENGLIIMRDYRRGD